MEVNPLASQTVPNWALFRFSDMPWHIGYGHSPCGGQGLRSYPHIWTARSCNGLKSYGEPVSIGNRSGLCFFANVVVQIDIGPSRPLSQALGMLLELFRLPGDEQLEILDPQPLVGYESFHGVGLSQGQVVLEENSVEAGNGAGDLAPVPFDEVFHGVHLSKVA